MDNTTLVTMKQLLPQEIMRASIWVAWGAKERNSKGKVAKTLVNPRGMLGFYAGWQDEDCETFDGAIGKLADAWEDDWISGGIGIHNIERANIVCVDVDNVHLDVAIALHAQVGGILERSPSGNGYHIWGAGSVSSNQSYQTAVAGCVVGVEVIGAKGKWCTMTCDVIAGVWGELSLPEPVSGSKGLSVSAPVAALREAFLGSTKGNRHDALYKYCRGLQASLVAIGEADESIYYGAVEKAVKAHSEYLEGGEAWQWLATAKSVWKSTPYSETVDAHKVQTGAVFEVIEPEEVQKQIEEVREDGRSATAQDYWDIVAEEYKPVRIIRDLFLGQVTFQLRDGSWQWVDSREVRAVLRAKIRRMGKSERILRGLSVSGAEDFLFWWAKDYDQKGIRTAIADWDGRDRLAELAGALNAKDKRLSRECVEYFVKDWSVKVWAKLYNPQITNRMILLQGGQGIGKDSWALTLAHGFGANFGIPALMSAKMLSEQTLARVVSDKAVCLFDEFDKLAGAEALIKSLITKRHFDIEVKYENNPTKIDHRCSYLGTTNSSVFNDSTGNRRFLFFELEGGIGEAIRFSDFPAPEADEAAAYQAQVLAQSYYLYKANGDMPLPINEAHEAVMRAIQADVTPEDAGVELVDSMQVAIEKKIEEAARFGRPWKRFYTSGELATEFKEVAAAHGLSIAQVKSTYKKAGGYRQIKRLGVSKRVYSTLECFESEALVTQYFEQSDIPF